MLFLSFFLFPFFISSFLISLHLQKVLICFFLLSPFFCLISFQFPLLSVLTARLCFIVGVHPLLSSVITSVQVILSPPLSVGPSPSTMSSYKSQANCTVMGKDISGSLKLFPCNSEFHRAVRTAQNAIIY